MAISVWFLKRIIIKYSYDWFVVDFLNFSEFEWCEEWEMKMLSDPTYVADKCGGQRWRKESKIIES